MAGDGGRRDEGNNNKNAFAALNGLKKKKKSDKERKNNRSEVESKEAEPQPFWLPTPIANKPWADVDDDDDYYLATTVPPQPLRQESESDKSKENQSFVEDSKGEEYISDEGDDDEEVEEEHDHEPKNEVEKPAEVSVALKEAERKLSKKEMKRKDLAEFVALLADFDVVPKESKSQDESKGAPQDKKDVEADYGENKENMNAEFKSSKKKKKKDKASKDKANVANTNNVGGEDVEVAAPENSEEDASVVDVKEQLKKVASMKKKKSSKNMDVATRAQTQEAAARRARLAGTKKKDKGHYKEQPVR